MHTDNSLLDTVSTTSRRLDGISEKIDAFYAELLKFITFLVSHYSGDTKDELLKYFNSRSHHAGSKKQDLLPLLTYLAVGGKAHENALPLAAYWALHLAAAHMVDDLQDKKDLKLGNVAVAFMGVANLALLHLHPNQSTTKDIVDAFAKITILATNAQMKEQIKGAVLPRDEYFQTIVGKAATIISVGAWSGGRLANCAPSKLQLLKEFGLMWGMAAQFADDCQDLAEDLGNGVFTLPVIEGLSMNDHPHHYYLKRKLEVNQPTNEQILKIISILDEMGTIQATRQLAKVYQLLAAALFDQLPGLKTYFSSHAANHTS